MAVAYILAPVGDRGNALAGGSIGRLIREIDLIKQNSVFVEGQTF